MFLLRRKSEEDGAGAGDERGSAATLTRVRDIVEIVAIVAAGIWAFYTFVYENQIKPASSKPEMQIESSLTRIGERNGLIAVRSQLSVKNVGLTETWVYGLAESVVGTTVRARGVRGVPPPQRDSFRIENAPAWIASTPTAVFAFASLTTLADPRSNESFNFRPGQSAEFDRVFYVAAGRYDELNTHVALRFSAHATPIPFSLQTVDGIVHVVPSTRATTDLIDTTFGTLSLWR